MKTKKLFLSMAAIACMTMTSLMTSCSVEDNAVDDRPDLDLSAFPTDVPTVAGASRFISDLKLIGCTNDDAINYVMALHNNGWSYIPVDLNAGAGGDCVLLFFKYNDLYMPDQYTPITQLYLSNEKDAPRSVTNGGKLYNLVSYEGVKSFGESKGNLNSGTRKGDVIHLYYTRDSFSDGRAVASIDVNDTKKGAVGKNGAYDYVTTKRDGYNLNSGAGGKSLYLHAEVDSKPEMWEAEFSTDNSLCYLTGYHGDLDKITSINYPNYINGAKVIDSNSALQKFPNLKSLGFFNDTPFDNMPSLIHLSNLDKIYLLDDKGKVEAEDKLPNGIKTIRYQCFWGTKITNINTNQVTSIGDFAFEFHSALTSVIIPQAAKIGNRAFAGISSGNCVIEYGGNLSEWTPFKIGYSPNLYVKCQDGVLGWAGDGTPASNQRASTIYWKLTNDQKDLFLSSAYDVWPEDVPYCVPRSTLWKNYSEKVTKLDINLVYILPASAFEGFAELTSVTINDLLNTISDKAFYGCTKLQEVSLPATVANIGSNAFAGITGNLTIKFAGTETQWNAVKKAADWAGTTNVTVTFAQ